MARERGDTMTEYVEWEDRVTHALTDLYRSYGYGRYRMEKFEPYELYSEHKNYLKSSVITFPDSSGRLMALRPDVTMSVVRAVAPDEELKVYYSENVFRQERDTQEYREIRQIGLEYIGGETGYPEAETLLLAARSLECIGGPFALCISNMDLVATMTAGHTQDPEVMKRVLQAIRRRRPHTLKDLPVPEDIREKLRTLVTLPGRAEDAVAALRRMDDGSLTPPIDELETVTGVLEEAGFGEQIRVDFSILNDTDYYNGISFAGYMDGVPKAVLSGGRYDSLMHRFGKPQGGIGFAVYLGELERRLRTRPETDADILLVCGSAPVSEILSAVRKLTEEGYTVRACRQASEGFAAGRVIRLEEVAE